MIDISEFLLNEEKCLFQTQPHWVVYGLPSLFGGITISSFFVPFASFDVSAIFAGFTLFTASYSVINRRYTIFAITNKRVLKKTGLVSRSTSGVLLSKIESVDVDQSIAGRIFGFGNVIIRGVGGGVDIYPKVSHPFRFRKELAQILDHG